MSVSNLLVDNKLVLKSNIEAPESITADSVIADGVVIGTGTTPGANVLTLSGIAAPTAGALLGTHSIAVSINGVTYNMVLNQ